MAWLNLHSGEAKGLDDWHWVTVTAWRNTVTAPSVHGFGRRRRSPWTFGSGSDHCWAAASWRRREAEPGCGMVDGPLGGAGLWGALPERCGFCPHGGGQEGKRDAWRIPELTLWAFALLGGAGRVFACGASATRRGIGISNLDFALAVLDPTALVWLALDESAVFPYAGLVQAGAGP